VDGRERRHRRDERRPVAGHHLDDVRVRGDRLRRGRRAAADRRGCHDVRERPGWLQYNQFGYVPTGLGDVWGSAATTLEYTSADFAIAQLAARVGDTANAENFLRRAQNWRSLFQSGSKYLQPRNTDTTFPAFSPTQQNEYVEGNAASTPGWCRSTTAACSTPWAATRP